MTKPLPAPGDPDALEMALADRGPDVRRLRRLVDDATATPIYIDYHLSSDWFDGVANAVDALEDRLDADPITALLLAEHAIGRLESAALDDSDGHLGDAIPRLERVHAAACLRTDLEPLTLAARLTSLAAQSDLEAFHDAANTHAQPLGEPGLQALHRGSA